MNPPSLRQSLLAGSDSHGSSAAGPRPQPELLTRSEVRVLRYLPTNLTSTEIADELSVSRHTVKAHMRILYAKLGTHRRSETVAGSRELGLLAPDRLSAKDPKDVHPTV
jgi:LuxR family maltose regulon positive regulatory protein